MMDINQLNEHFGLPGVLAFHATESDLVRADITTPHATATVYLQGAHLTAWQPAGHQPAIFTSRKTDLAPGKAIRGGVPIAFPWFATRHDGKTGPSHGFARIQDWTLAFAALAGEDLHLTFTLGANDLSRSLGYDHFHLGYQLTIGSTLTMQLTVANDADTPLVFEEALHTYYAVADVHEIAIAGLDGVSYLDKVDSFKEKVQHGDITVTGPTDRVYLDTTATCTLSDPVRKRRIAVAKTGSNTTVVWNPWESGAAKLADMDPSEWHEFVAIETVNAATDAITLAPGATHTMQARVTLDELHG
ncbi:D-hexose-6-phosphate mutarotase [Tunturiibacter gelidoferens]|uniref:Glucose-6-phosphate 1-epimerase n=1 Tax=Tunturiibacter gelidiferens TaxID=3069689 RepID=A0ACC5P2G5_9BACT|nr:D-hexose-6-phosphate mutarotase [Edaphobacter lichenicola]MBB5340788.1 glucose-6-phosphate 1-epimerase [Edaphobacter lichenicola]